ncbi:hypothetical protein Pmani_011893 [Petrolisthes manimaculis]|uniref:Uncharacterized protein n=1 Tax=Petrolisthes manimaculis TaxID=1843537 RepID=A0AAE1Q1Z3_9EUCA|nr:hypothetical protein Pmani_011893 [Petrolisthes manimaculis]
MGVVTRVESGGEASAWNGDCGAGGVGQLGGRLHAARESEGSDGDDFMGREGDMSSRRRLQGEERVRSREEDGLKKDRMEKEEIAKEQREGMEWMEWRAEYVVVVVVVEVACGGGMMGNSLLGRERESERQPTDQLAT